MLFSLSFIAAVLPIFLLADAHSPSHARRHSDLAVKLRSAEPEPELTKRAQFSNQRATWYDVGLGACGKNNVASDFIIALNAPMYGGGYPGPQCFKTVSITCNGKTANAQIMDECMGCPGSGGIDMSKGLFQYFAPLGVGTLNCDWSYAGGGGGGGNNGGNNNGDDSEDDDSWTPPPPPHKHTSTPPPPAYHPPTSSHKPTSTRSSVWSAPSSHKVSSTKNSAYVAPTPDYTGPQNIQNMFQAMVGMGGLVVGVAE